MKSKNLTLLVAMLTCCFTLKADCKEMNSPQEIRIQLSSESSLQPIYCSSISQTDTSFSVNYLKDLEKVISHDFNNNGKTKVINKSAEKDKVLSNAISKNATDLKLWRTTNIPYGVKFTIISKKLSVTVLDNNTNHIKTISDVMLTGNLSEDRRSVHKIADMIHYVLFNEIGIANSRILYSFQNKAFEDGSKSISEIWECDWDGYNAKQVTKENTFCVTPVLLPKGNSSKDMFFYVNYKTGQPKIYISSMDGNQNTKAVDIRGNQLLPAISKNRDLLAFICDASGRADLFVQSIEPSKGKMGTPIQLFSYPRSTQASPTFSPDGTKIAFASDKDGSTRIYTIPSIRGEKRAQPVLITKQNRENSCPSWSPDGTKLAYSAKTEGIRQIWIYDFTTGEESQLTFGGGNKENPCWAENSLHLIFNSTDSNSSDLYVVNLKQPEAIRITNGPGKKHYPTWGPR